MAICRGICLRTAFNGFGNGLGKNERRKEQSVESTCKRESKDPRMKVEMDDMTSCVLKSVRKETKRLH